MRRSSCCSSSSRLRSATQPDCARPLRRGCVANFARRWSTCADMGSGCGVSGGLLWAVGETRLLTTSAASRGQSPSEHQASRAAPEVLLLVPVSVLMLRLRSRPAVSSSSHVMYGATSAPSSSPSGISNMTSALSAPICTSATTSSASPTFTETVMLLLSLPNVRRTSWLRPFRPDSARHAHGSLAERRRQRRAAAAATAATPARNTARPPPEWPSARGQMRRASVTSRVGTSAAEELGTVNSGGNAATAP
mmetsp:Transcript_58233/g.96458  ORF Transcript_58233/g.96458 Transcript_58233/m.96458 type:complete len:251 (+) Transcript_58233:1408-2160(+)